MQVISSSTETAPNNSHNDERTPLDGDLLERHHLDADLAVGLGVLLSELRLHDGQVRARLFQRDARLEAADADVPRGVPDLRDAALLDLDRETTGPRRGRERGTRPA